MTRLELLDYIKNRSYLCEFCHGLQQEVIRSGLKAIKEYKGMICGGVQDMQIRLYETEVWNQQSELKECSICKEQKDNCNLMGRIYVCNDCVKKEQEKLRQKGE